MKDAPTHIWVAKVREHNEEPKLSVNCLKKMTKLVVDMIVIWETFIID